MIPSADFTAGLDAVLAGILLLLLAAHHKKPASPAGTWEVPSDPIGTLFYLHGRYVFLLFGILLLVTGILGYYSPAPQPHHHFGRQTAGSPPPPPAASPPPPHPSR